MDHDPSGRPGWRSHSEQRYRGLVIRIHSYFVPGYVGWQQVTENIAYVATVLDSLSPGSTIESNPLPSPEEALADAKTFVDALIHEETTNGEAPW